jgi:hypothetical protein
MFMLGILVGINIVGFIVLLLLSNKGGYWDTLIYPALWDVLYDLHLSTKLHRMIAIIFTIVFLPAVIIYFTLLTIWILITVAIIILCEWFEKRFKNKEN